MNRPKFKWSNSGLRARAKRHAPTWLWKWTEDAWHVYKQKRKEGRLP